MHAPAVRGQSHLRAPPLRRVGGQSEAGAPTVSAGRAAGPHARETAQAHGIASRPRAGADRSRAALEHGFVHDALIDGRAFRVLSFVDQWSRESPLLEVRFFLTGQHVVGAFEDHIGEVGLPKSIAVDHGSEFTSTAVEAWAFCRGVELDFTRPGTPTDNAHIEFFNGRLCDKRLCVHQFLSLEYAQRLIEAWRVDCSHHRPHSALGDLTPSVVAHRPQDIMTATKR